jgi:hypothetical protein
LGRNDDDEDEEEEDPGLGAQRPRVR